MAKTVFATDGNDDTLPGVYYREPLLKRVNPKFTFRELFIACAVLVEMFHCLCMDSGEMVKHGDNGFWIAISSLIVMIIPTIAAFTTTVCLNGRVNPILFVNLAASAALVVAWTVTYFVENFYLNRFALEGDSGVPMKVSSVFQTFSIATSTYSFILYFSSSCY